MYRVDYDDLGIRCLLKVDTNEWFANNELWHTETLHHFTTAEQLGIIEDKETDMGDVYGDEFDPYDCNNLDYLED